MTVYLVTSKNSVKFNLYTLTDLAIEHGFEGIKELAQKANLSFTTLWRRCHTPQNLTFEEVEKIQNSFKGKISITLK